jgi:hypothetical protein
MQMSTGNVQEYIASGTNTNGRIVLAHIKASASGSAIFQRDCVTHCRRRFLRRKKCTTDCYNRAFNAAELNVIQNGLIGHAYNQLEARYVDFQNNVNNRPDMIALNSDLEKEALALGLQNGAKYGGRLGMIPFTGYGEMITAVSLAYDVALKLFSTSIKTEIVEQYTNLSFESYDNLVTVQQYVGVAERNIGSLKNVISRYLDIPADKLEDFKSYIDFADMGDATVWNNFQTLLKTDNSGNSKSINILFNFDNATSKYNVIVTETRTQFQVADDIYVMKKTKSTFGGAFVKEDFQIKRQPHTVTAEDAEVLMNYFDLIAYRKLRIVFEGFNPSA